MSKLVDNAAQRRFEMTVDGAVAFVEYAPRAGNTLELIHTEVPEPLSGRGVGSRLAEAVLDEARRRGAGVVPTCEFIAGYIARHPEFRDLLRQP
jgi:predicted GNAT family acetyltransferase